MSFKHGAAFKAVLVKELNVAFRQRSDLVNPLLFFILVVMLFPLGVGPEPNLLARMAPGVLWVAALLATLLGLDRLFKDDYADGSLEQLLLSPLPLGYTALAKVVAHWLLTGLPLVLLSPLVALLLNLNENGWIAAFLTLLIGTPLLSLIGAIGAALTVGLKKGGVLLSLLVLPLYIPVLIFATSALDVAAMGGSILGHLAILGAMLCLALALAPLAIAGALRVSVH